MLIPMANSCNWSARAAMCSEGWRNAETARKPPLHLRPGNKPPTATQSSFELPSTSAISAGVCHLTYSQESCRDSCHSKINCIHQWNAAHKPHSPTSLELYIRVFRYGSSLCDGCPFLWTAIVMTCFRYSDIRLYPWGRGNSEKKKLRELI